MAARKSPRATVLAPMSDTAARLLHQLLQDAADAAAPAPGSITLKPVIGLKHQPDYSTDLSFVAYGEGLVDVRWRRHPCSDMPQWIGHEERKDDQGRRWNRVMWGIVDDFGTLVEVSP
ncbi:hypothetical protein [Variovorax atrisoli]|uniref:hypothetical protein n=1 Tax=Variovorax atrisoli TaxID=3394203 RepID=UPI00404008BE